MISRNLFQFPSYMDYSNIITLRTINRLIFLSTYVVYSKKNDLCLFNQDCSKALLKKMNISKEKANVLGSWLQQRSLLQHDTKISLFPLSLTTINCLFYQENKVLFCTDINAFIEKLWYVHVANEWKLFIDTSKVSHKDLLLLKGNEKPPIFKRSTWKKHMDRWNPLMKKVNKSVHMGGGDLKIISYFLEIYQRYVLLVFLDQTQQQSLRYKSMAYKKWAVDLPSTASHQPLPHEIFVKEIIHKMIAASST